MDAGEVVVSEVKGNGGAVVLQFLRVGVREAREAADLHPHREVLALDVGGRDKLLDGEANDRRL